MDTSDPDISFDDKGVCNHCRSAESQLELRVIRGEAGERRFREIVDEIKKKGKGRAYDCILGISGGADSSYLAAKVVESGLRPLAVHFDSGWNSELAVKNIEKLVNKLGIDLYTVVCDWREMRDLQRSFFRASLVNCDTPQDHAFVTVLWQQAAKNRIRYVFSGHNTNTESVLPKSFRGNSSRDWRLIKTIQKRFGTLNLRRFPRAGFLRQIWFKYMRGFDVIKALDYLDYDKASAINLLRDQFGWVEYSGKHGESRFTRFFQGYYLPKKFGIEKRRAHFSSMVISGQMTREAALEQLNKKFYADETELRQEKDFFLKKLRIEPKEWEEIMALPKRDQYDYSSDEWLYRLENRIVGLAAKIIKALMPGRVVQNLRERNQRRFK